jgi:hypothetical protein
MHCAHREKNNNAHNHGTNASQNVRVSIQ